MSNEYDITMLADLLKLEDDQIDRLCAELPSIIKHVRALVDLIGAVNEGLGGESPAVEALTPLIWIDDGKQNIDINISSAGDEVLNYKVRSK